MKVASRATVDRKSGTDESDWVMGAKPKHHAGEHARSGGGQALKLRD